MYNSIYLVLVFTTMATVYIMVILRNYKMFTQNIKIYQKKKKTD